LLLATFQIAGGICLGTQHLDRIHDVTLLRQKSIAQFLRPVDLFIHLLQNLRYRGQ
jgi:hypothetical protein